MEVVYNYILDNFLFGDNSKYLEYNTPFFEKGIIDSTGLIELVSFIEENFRIQVYMEEISPENFTSLETIENFIQGKLKSNAA